MNDDWRVQVTCPTTATAANLGELLREGDFEHGLPQAAADRVIVSVDGHELFLYAGTREQAEQATEAVRSLVATSGVTLETQLRHWHPAAEEWEDPDVPLPVSAGAVSAEHEELIEREREESAELKHAEYEVRVQTQSHRDTLDLAERLREQGIPSLHRWHYLLVGAADEDAANALAQQISALVPEGSTVEVEGSASAVEAELPFNPFAVFGGLGA